MLVKDDHPQEQLKDKKRLWEDEIFSFYSMDSRYQQLKWRFLFQFFVWIGTSWIILPLLVKFGLVHLGIIHLICLKILFILDSIEKNMFIGISFMIQ